MRPSDSQRHKMPVRSSALACAVFIVALLGAARLVASPVPAYAAASADAAAPAVTTPQEHTAGTFQPEHAEEVSRQSVHGEPAWVVIARFLNFAVLVGVLVYFLRAPIAGYLSRRSTEIRSDLVTAAETREAASEQMARVEKRLQSLPSEIEALKARGIEEVAAEEARILKAAETERNRLMEQARRDIDMRLRAAKRDLVKQAADLAVGLASDRIKRNITDADQQRLVDRYLTQIRK